MEDHLPNECIFFDLKNLVSLFEHPPADFISALKFIENISLGNILIASHSVIYEHLKIAKTPFDYYKLIVHYNCMTKPELIVKNYKFSVPTFEFVNVFKRHFIDILKIFKKEVQHLRDDSKFSHLTEHVNYSEAMTDFILSLGAPRIYAGRHFLSSVDLGSEVVYLRLFNDEKIEKRTAEKFALEALNQGKFKTFKYFFEKISEKEDLFKKVEVEMGGWEIIPEMCIFLKQQGMTVSEKINSKMEKPLKDFFPVKKVVGPEVVVNFKKLKNFKGHELEAIKILIEQMSDAPSKAE